MDTDEVVPLSALRRWLEVLTLASYQSIGHRRIKNPRIWSVHDLEILTRARGAAQDAVPEQMLKTTESVAAPEAGAVAIRSSMDGSFWGRSNPGTDAFVSAEQNVSIGDTVGLVEVMKTFSPIRVEVGGVWIGTALDDGEAIQPGTIVGWVRPG